MLNILRRPRAYLVIGFLFYTIYHLYAALELFAKDLPNNHIIKRAAPLVNFLQGTTAAFEKPPVENMYGPIFNLIMHPVVVLSDFQAPVYKFAMIYTAAISVLILLMTLFFYYARGFSFNAKLMICLLVLNFQPLIYDVQTTMPELWQLAFVAVGIVAYKKNSFFLCGFCLAAATLIKVYPLLLIFLFLLIRKRVFFWGVVSLMILLGITRFLYGDAMGFGYVAGLIRRLSPSVGDSVFNHGILGWDGIAFKSMLLKWFVGFRSTPEGVLILPDAGFIRTVSIIAAVTGVFVLLLLIVFYLRIKKTAALRNPKFCEDFLISMGCLYPLLFGPNSGFEYLVLSFPAFLLLLPYLRQGLERRYLIGALAAYFLLTGIIMPNTLFLKLTHFNEAAIFFLPQLATRQPYEIYRFLGMHNIGLLSLTAAWFILPNYRIARFKKEEEIKLGVCMVVSAYYPQGFGGSGQCRSLIQALNNSFSFYVLAASFNPPEDERTKIIDGARVFRIKVWKNQVFNLFFAAPQYLWVFLRIARRIQVVHCHGVSSKNYLVILLAKMFGKKIIQKFTSLGFDDPLTLQSNLDHQGVLGKVAKKILLRCDCFIGITPAFLERIKKSFLNGKHFLEIPNGVNLERFRPAANTLEKEKIREKLGVSPETKVILFVGFFSREKGVRDLFFAWGKIKKKISPSLLVLVGSTDSQYQEISSELIREIRETIQRERLDSSVLFREKVDTIEEYYRMANLFVLPSHREGLPNTLLEAMACGTAVVVSRLPGVADVTVQDGKTGLLFTPGNITELSERILAVLTNSSLALSLGDAGRKYVEQHYNIREIAERYAVLYRKLGAGCDCD